MMQNSLRIRFESTFPHLFSTLLKKSFYGIIANEGHINKEKKIGDIKINEPNITKIRS